MDESIREYINDETIIKNDFYNSFQDSITCPLCLCILIDPVMCMKCQNVYCKKCADDWAKKDSKCPNRCQEPQYTKSLLKDEILSKLNFKCKKCKQTISYKKCKNHKNICGLLDEYEIIDEFIESDTPGGDTPTQTPNPYSTPKFDKIKNLTSEEMSHLNKSEINYMTSK